MGTVASVVLSGQPLVSNGAIGRASLNVGALPGVTFPVSPLISDVAISRAALNIGAIPAGVVFAGQPLTARGTIAQATLKILLRLVDSDDTGLDVVAKALLVASAPGTAINNIYADADRGGTDTPLDGELGLGAGETLISRIRRTAATNLTFNDNDNPVELDVSAYFLAGGDGNDLTLYLQTRAHGEVSLVAADTYLAGNPNFARFTLSQAAQNLLDGIATGDRWIVKFARPAPAMFAGQPLVAIGVIAAGRSCCRHGRGYNASWSPFNRVGYDRASVLSNGSCFRGCISGSAANRNSRVVTSRPCVWISPRGCAGRSTANRNSRVVTSRPCVWISPRGCAGRSTVDRYRNPVEGHARFRICS